MKDEIKEILDKLKETADYPKLNYSSYDKSYNETIDNVAMIKSFACKQLLDYITNLQKYYNDNVNKYEELLVKYSNLHNENKRLNNITNELEKYYDENIENCINGMNMLNSNSNEAKRLTTRFVVYNESLGKLKELKEGKNNE